MSKKLGFFILLLAIFGGFNCLVVGSTFSGLPPGPWRAVLRLEPSLVVPNPRGEPLPEKVNLEFEEVTKGELPFNFEVVYEEEGNFHIVIKNADERIRIDDITIGRDRSTAKDTVIIEFPVFDSYIRAIYEENILEGRWVVRNRDNGSYSIPFVAWYGKDHRFTTLRKEPKINLSGRWEVDFEVDTDTPFKAIGEFRQKGNHLTGTFLTETGDYRYLEGTVQANKVYLSTFDGSHAFLFEAKIQDDSTLIGSFRSGKHYQTVWEAKRNPSFELRSPKELTYLQEGYDKVSFSFENLNGDTISLDDPKYDNKVKIVQIMGSWCPNCRDETEFLTQYLEKNNLPDLEVIALAFEKYREKEKAVNILSTYKEKMNVNYEILLAGYSDKSEAAKALPMLNHILSYPTLIFIDREDKVRRIHTGFSGPATSAYEAFTRDFDKFVKSLLKEL